MRRAIILASATLLLGACVTNPETGKSSFNIMPDGVMNSLGAQGYNEILQTEAKSQDRRLNEIVSRVASRIAEASGENYDWEFTLVENKQANAFCMPGGKIMVYSGILPYCQHEAGLAFVIGHEVAHAVAEHSGQRMSSNIGLQGALIAASSVFAGNANHDMIMAALGAGARVGVELPFSRDHESEADWMGLRYMARAGYDPNGAAGFWTRMEATGVPEFLSTHPSHGSRDKDIRDSIVMAMEIYQKTPVKHGLGVNLIAGGGSSGAGNLPSVLGGNSRRR